MDNTFKISIPYIPVQDVQASIIFYQKLGFEIFNTFIPPGAQKPSWAFLKSGGACLMVALASGPIDPEQQAAMVYLYCPDVPAKHQELQKLGLNPSALRYPPPAPKGEFRLPDPDGYSLMIMHT